MACVAVNKNGDEYIYETMPERFLDYRWVPKYCDYLDRTYDSIMLSKGSIEKLIGKKLTWSDEPVELN